MLSSNYLDNFICELYETDNFICELYETFV